MNEEFDLDLTTERIIGEGGGRKGLGEGGRELEVGELGNKRWGGWGNCWF